MFKNISLCVFLVTFLFSPPSFSQDLSPGVSYNYDYDEFTEKDNSSVIVVPTDLTSNGFFLLGWKCFPDGLNVVLAHSYMGGDSDDDISVQYKFDNDKPSGTNWFHVQSGGKITFFDMSEVKNFTEKALSSTKVMIRLIDPVDNDSNTRTFPLSNLGENLAKLKCFNVGG